MVLLRATVWFYHSARARPERDYAASCCCACSTTAHHGSRRATCTARGMAAAPLSWDAPQAALRGS